MSLGIQLTKSDVDAMAGGTARDLNVLMARIKQFSTWLTATPDATLTAMGYTAGEVASLRSSYTDATTGLDRLRNVYEGGTTVSVAQDFRTFPKTIYGFGI